MSGQRRFRRMRPMGNLGSNGFQKPQVWFLFAAVIGVAYMLWKGERRGR